MASVFLCHSSRDKPFVRELYRRLQRDGVTCFFDEVSIEWGDNFVLSLEAGLTTCTFVLLVLTPDFLHSKWTALERTTIMSLDPQKIRPLLRVDCRQSTAFPAFLRPIHHLDVTSDLLFEQHYPTICRSLGGTPGADPEVLTDRTQLPPASSLPPCTYLPHRSLKDRFVGRVEPLWTLHDALSEQGAAVVQGIGVVTGVGGLGKTQLAIEYAHRFALHYPGGIFWIDAEQGITALITRIANTAEIEYDPTTAESDQLQAIWRNLGHHAPSLVILDNFPEEQPLKPWLPPGGRICVLVTTRRTDLTHYPQVGLAVLSPEEGRHLLNSGQRTYGDEANTLVEAVGGLPLALELLRAFLDQKKHLSVSDVLAELTNTEAVNLLESCSQAYRDELPSGHERSVLNTFALSWHLADPDAQQVLAVMAHLAPYPVPRRVLRAILGWSSTSVLHDPLDACLETLERLSLLESDAQNDPLAHRLILGFARTQVSLAPEVIEAIYTTVNREMKRAFDDHDSASLTELGALVPHAEVVLNGETSGSARYAELANNLARHHQQHGRYEVACALLRQALAAAEQSFALGHPSIATSQSNLAQVLKDLGELVEARDLLRQALTAAKQSFASGHPSIAIRQSALALVLKDLGELSEARDLLRQALAADEQSFPPGHPLIAIRQSNLASVLKALGELNEARDLLRQALAACEQSFAPGHPHIATHQSNLALVLQDLGELNEARDLLRQALTADEQSFAPGHPHITRSQSNLAMVLRNLGELNEARDLLRQALAADEQSFAPGHPHIATHQSNLALVLKDLGELSEAHTLLQQAFSTFLEKLGPEHPHTKRVKNHLDTALKAMASS